MKRTYILLWIVVCAARLSRFGNVIFYSFSHPFYIKTIPSTTSGNAYTNGVTSNGITVGSLTFTVPMDAPNPNMA